MAYTKQNFKNGETLTAENLNLMEDGIVAKVDESTFDTAINKLETNKLDKGKSIDNQANFLYVHKLDGSGTRTGQYVRMRGDVFEAYYKTDTVQAQGQYTINGAELYRKEFDENGNVIKSYNTKYRKEAIEGNNEDGNYFKLKLPREAGTRTIATSADISQVQNSITQLQSSHEQLQSSQNQTNEDLVNHKIRRGDWYNTEVMSQGVDVDMGRMYLITGTEIQVFKADGSTIAATDEAIITSEGTKMLILVLPNTVAVNGGGYRCKAAWATSSSGLGGIFGGDLGFTSKDFLLSADTEKLKIKATGGTSVWSI